jgi:hypothetical protein
MTVSLGATVDATVQIRDGLPHVDQNAFGMPEAPTATCQIADFIGGP